MKKMKRTAPFQCVVALAFIASLSSACSDGRRAAVEEAFGRFRGGHVLYVSKKDFRLYVFSRDLRVVAGYKIAYGMNPDRKSKLYAGDNRTPEGNYRITEILSMDAQAGSPSYRKLSAYNRVYFRAADGHFKYGKPHVDLGENVYGPRYYLLDYPSAKDMAVYRKAVEGGLVPRVHGQPAAAGKGIAIHGNNDEESIGHLATSGCIRMFNTDIIELERFVQINTPVIISPR